MVDILDLLSSEQLAGFKEDLNGNFKGDCPCCGKQDNYSGFVIFPKTNTAYCHSSRSSFGLLEFVALLNGLISCREGRQKI